MRIAVDAHTVGLRETGGERYALHLVAGLARVDEENRYSLLVTDPWFVEEALSLPSNFQVLPIRPAANVPRVAWAMPRACRRVEVDVLHVSYTAPPICPCPTVVTVHDISYEFFPRFFSLRDRMLLSVTVPLSCRQAARVIAVSEWTRRDLIQRYGVPPQKIRVVYEAADERFTPDAPVEESARVRGRYAGGRRYILALGNIQPRKNLNPLIDAFAALVAEGVVGEDLVLVIAGQSRWRGSPVYQKVREQGLGERVLFPGYIPEDDLPALYRGAEVFAFPSLYEGFGLPPLEAMACGVPVVCSNAASMPEVVGEAALLFDPRDTGALVKALRDILAKGDMRRAFSSAGLARASKFSWERAARETIEVYREAAGG